MPNSETRKGEIYIILSNVTWSVFPILIVLSFSKLPGLVSLIWSSIFAAVFFLGVILNNKSWVAFSNKTFWKYTSLVILTNGIIFYSLYYLGLEHTSPNNVSLLGQTEILTSFLFFNLFKKEYISKNHVVGILLMALGAVIVLSRNFSDFNIGDILILIAVCSAPIGNYFQQKVRKIAPTEPMLFLRYVITIPFVMLLAFMLDHNVSFAVTRESFVFLLISGVIIMGVGKICWIEGIHRISVTKANGLCALGPLVTMLISWLVLKQAPTLIQLTAFIPLVLGLLLLTDNLKLGNRLSLIKL